MKLTQCRQPGCFLFGEGRYCPRHAHLQAGDDARRREVERAGWDRLHEKQEATGQRSLYRTTRWRKLRASTLAASPSCMRCGQPATEVHHVEMPGADEARFFAPGNLMALCRGCHLIASRAQRHAQPLPPSGKQGARQ